MGEMNGINKTRQKWKLSSDLDGAECSPLSLANLDSVFQAGSGRNGMNLMVSSPSPAHTILAFGK